MNMTMHYKIHSSADVRFTHLGHLAPIEEVLHHKQIELLLSVVLRVLVPNTVNSQNLRKRCRPLRTGSGKRERNRLKYKQVFLSHENKYIY